MVGKIVSHYKILKFIGEGGMGQVYLAHDLKLERPVIIKFLPANLTTDPDARERFLREARAAAILNHPNIVTIYEIGEHDEKTFIAMEYVEGSSLREKMASAALSREDIIDVVVQVARGLSKAHQQGIVHRDIKPDNILIGQDGCVKIVDFGIAKLTGASKLTKKTSTVGTVYYMSPEQAMGEEVDHRTDIWSLGVVFYEMLTGHLPFRGEYEQAVVYSIINQDPDFSFFATLPPFLADVVAKMLAKHPEQRFQAMDQVIESLQGEQQSAERDRRPIPASFIGGSLRRRAAKFWPLLLITVVLLVAVFIWDNFFKSSLALGARDYIMVAEFENTTQEDVFNHSLTEALRVTLGQSPYINLLPRSRIFEALERMRLPVHERLDEETSIAIARRENAPLVVSGLVNQLGTKYILMCKIINVSTDEAVKLRRVEVERIEDVLNAMDKLAKEIRKDLGESLRSISKSSTPLEDVTTSSLDALELYSRANLFDAQGEYAKSIDLLERAVAIDSAFTMALNSLSYNYTKVGDLKKAYYYHNKVLPLIDRVTDRERFFILTIYYGPTFEYDFQKAFQYGKQHILLYPNDAVGHATLGHLAMFAGDFESALASNQAAMELDSSLSRTCYSNSGFANALAGNAVQAYECFQKSKKLRPDYLALDGYLAQVEWMADKLDSAELTFQSILPKADPLRRAKTCAHLAALYHFQGRLQHALAACDQGLEASQKTALQGDQAYFFYLIAEIEMARGQKEKYLTSIQKAIQFCDTPYFELVFSAASLAKHGYSERARQVLQQLAAIQSDNPLFRKRHSSFENYIQGALELYAQNDNAARECFQRIDKLHSGDPLYWLAQKEIALAMTGLGDSTALQIYHEILQHQGEVFMGFLPTVRNGGFWTSWLWPDVFFELGKEYLAEKDTVHAVESFQKAARYWKSADKDFINHIELQKMLHQIGARDSQ